MLRKILSLKVISSIIKRRRGFLRLGKLCLGLSSTIFIQNFIHLIELNDLLNCDAVNSSNRFFKVPKWEYTLYPSTKLYDDPFR